MKQDSKNRMQIGFTAGGIGFVGSIIGMMVFFEFERDLPLNGDESAVLLLFLLGIYLVSIGLIVWGSVAYAQNKGYSGSLGLLALLGIPGIVALLLIPARGFNDTLPEEWDDPPEEPPPVRPPPEDFDSYKYG